MTHIQEIMKILDYYKKQKQPEEPKIKFVLQEKAIVRRELKHCIKK